MSQYNPELYRRMCEPVTAAEAEQNVQRFWEQVYKLREECHIPDVHLIVKIHTRYDDGEQGAVYADMHAGNELEAEPMTAWAYGRQAADRQERLAKLVSQAKAVRTQRSSGS